MSQRSEAWAQLCPCLTNSNADILLPIWHCPVRKCFSPENESEELGEPRCPRGQSKGLPLGGELMCTKGLHIPVTTPKVVHLHSA